MFEWLRLESHKYCSPPGPLSAPNEGTMRNMIVAFALCCTLAASFRLAPSQTPAAPNLERACSDTLERAFDAFQRVKPGMSRREVEAMFKKDGGLQFRDTTRYIYADSAGVTIKADIEFKPAATAHTPEFSPDDAVVNISKPYLAYESRD